MKRKDGGIFMNSRLSLVFAAAGMSNRMGVQKQLMRLSDGRSLAEFSLANYLKIGFSEIKAVIGSSRTEVEGALSRFDDPRISFIFNPDYEKGLGTSVAAGVRALSEDSDGCMIALADMPYVTSSMLESLVSCWEKDIKKIAAPCFEGRRGNPVIFPKSCFEELACLSGDRGGASVIKSRPELLYLAEMDNGGFLKDIDFLDEWHIFEEYAESRK